MCAVQGDHHGVFVLVAFIHDNSVMMRSRATPFLLPFLIEALVPHDQGDHGRAYDLELGEEINNIINNMIHFKWLMSLL